MQRFLFDAMAVHDYENVFFCQEKALGLKAIIAIHDRISDIGLAAVGLLVTLIPALPIVIIGLGMLTLGMFSTVPAVNLYLGEVTTTAKGTASSMYLSMYYFGGSIGAVLPGFALLSAGWPGVVLLCLGMILIALGADTILCH